MQLPPAEWGKRRGLLREASLVGGVASSCENVVVAYIILGVKEK